MTCALAIVALAAVLQMLALGESASEPTESAAILTPLPSIGPGSNPPGLVVYHQFESEETGFSEPLNLSAPEVVYQPAALFPATPEPRQTATNYVTPASTIEVIATRVQQYGGTLSEAEMVAVLREAGWPESLIPQALAVSFCESRWSPYAQNGGNFGLFQANETSGATIRGPWRAYFGMPAEEWSNPVSAALEARYIYEYAGGWRLWACQP